MIKTCDLHLCKRSGKVFVMYVVFISYLNDNIWLNLTSKLMFFLVTTEKYCSQVTFSI